MHVAAYYGNVSVVVMLLQNGGSPDVTNMVSKLRTLNSKGTGNIYWLNIGNIYSHCLTNYEHF